jgi:hypothetical protein
LHERVWSAEAASEPLFSLVSTASPQASVVAAWVRSIDSGAQSGEPEEYPWRSLSNVASFLDRGGYLDEKGA